MATAKKKTSKASKTAKAKTSKTKKTGTLSKIMTKAKKIYKENPNKKWQSCIKLAAKELKK